MSSLIETLNLWGGRIPDFAWPMLWQSSLLIAVLFAFDLATRRKVRAAVRYALWLVVLVKLLLPPTLALPTSLAWWVRPPASPPTATARSTAFVVTYGDFVPANIPTPAPPVFVPAPRPSLSGAGRTAATWVVVGVGLLLWLVARWRKVGADVRHAMVAPESLNQVLDQSRHCIKLPRRVRLLVTKRAMSPAVCGLFRPVILLPQPLVERLTLSQLRAVLLHELAHLRRGDVWVNCLQALLQIFYWWHPFLWLANARIRRVREEAVDDAVMLALRDDAETYAPTLLEVAKLAFNRPLASLGLVGIMESRSALRQRIERLVDFRPPRKAGLTVVSALCVLAFAALAVPMEQAPVTNANQISVETQSAVITTLHSTNSLDRTKEAIARNEKVKAKMKITDGRILLEDGKLDEAEVMFKEAIVLDPENRAALFYLNRVKEARYNNAERQREQPLRNSGVEIEQAWSTPIKHEALLVPNPYATANLIFAGEGRQVVVSKLDRIRLDTVLFQKVGLSEVVRNLSEETKKRDPERKGINFMVNPNAAAPAVVVGGPVDPTTGLPTTAAAPAEATDINTVSINIDPPLSNVRLADVMEAIVRVADKPIKYTLEDYGVVFSLRGPETEPLSVRQFKVDPNTFEQGLQAVAPFPVGAVPTSGGGGQGAGLSFITRTQGLHSVSVAAATFFSTLGVDLASPKAIALGKAVFWSARKGIVLVRATRQDLDTIEVGIESLMATPDRNIEAERRAVLSSATPVSAQKQSESTNPPPVELSNTNEEVKLRMIVLNKPVGGGEAQVRKRAEEILQRIKEGAAFAEMASVHSEGRQGREGGDWGWLQKYRRGGGLELRKELADAAFSLKPGEVSGVIETPDVIYLMMVEDKRPVPSKALSAQGGGPSPPAQEQSQSDRDRKIEAIQHASPPPNSRATTNVAFNGIGRHLLEAIVKGADKPIPYFIGSGVGFYSTDDEPALPRGMTLQKALPLVNATQPVDAIDPTARMTNTVPVLGELPFIGRLFRGESARATNGSFGNALPKSLYERTPGPRIVAQMYFQVELREDGSYWASGKQMNLAELRDWLVKTKQSDSNSNVGFQVHSNAPHGAIRALTELDKELGLVIGAPAAPAALASSSQDGQLSTRSYKVDQSTFYKGLQSVTQSPVSQTNIPAVTRDWFATLGVDWSPPKTIVWNDRSGVLQVRATEQNLDIIEAAMEMLNRVPPQINIKARFVEIKQEDWHARGFDWFLRTILLTNGIAANLKGEPWAEFQGVLTDVQYRVVLRAFEQRSGADVLTTPEVTTLSGRQAQIQVVEMKTIVTGINPQVAVSSTNGVFQTQAMPFGPVLDVIPNLSADGYTINLKVISTVTEFDGYVDPVTHRPVSAPTLLDQTIPPMPRFRSRQMTVTANVRDGQTLVLGNPATTEILRKPDGSTETKDVSDAQKKQFIVFVTPTLVDETGNRIHRDDEPAAGPK